MIHGLPQVVHQGHLERVVHSLFKGEHIQVNVRKDAKIKNTSTGALLELDLWIPNLQICFEFQDPYHYTTSWDSNIPLGLVKKKDALKREEMERRGETVIVVPFWWDGSEKSLATAVEFHRPDLIRGSLGEPVTPLNPDYSLFKEWIPDVGELMLASFPIANFAVSNIDAQNFWWLGEKYDGLRVVWNPIHRCLYSRYANEVIFPFSKHFPKSTFLDAEIWFGRGLFEEVQNFINNEEIEWNLLRVVGFDDASPKNRKEPFELRYANVISCLDTNNSLLTLATRIQCSQGNLISLFISFLLSDAGEGVIIRKPLSRYVSGRSRYLYKLKATRGDAEGLVTESDKGDGWILVQLPNGKFVRMQKPIDTQINVKRGDIVSFSYENFSPRSIPVNPKMERIRTEMTWENVVKEFRRKSESLKLNADSSRLFGKRRQIPEHKKRERKKQMRAFFENYASLKKFDPLKPENWYDANKPEIRNLKGANRVLRYYSGSIMKALIDLYPSIKFDKTKFQKTPNNYWASETNRRNYIIKFAANRGFDALVAKNWYKANIAGFIKTKGLASVVWYYAGSIARALVHLFPEIGIEKSKLKFARKSTGKMDLRTQESRTNIFIQYAKKKGFDPYEPTSWYQVNEKHLKKERGVNTVLTHHTGSLVKSLRAAFPKIGLEATKFGFLTKNMYKDPKHRREFFVNFAQSRHFDPLVPSNWYPILKKDLVNVKGIYGVLSFHQENVIKALCDLFPEIGLQSNMFAIVQRNYWADPSNRRNYFIQFAREHAFDPLIAENWYSFKKGDIPKHHVLQYHKNILAIALVDLFPNIGLAKENFVK